MTRMPAARGATLVVVTLASATCHVGELVEQPDAPIRLTLSQVEVADSVAVGSAARLRAEVAVAAAGQPTGWTARVVGAAPWLTLGAAAGETPGTITLWLDPAGLATGTYRDTVIVEPAAAVGAPAQLPVRLTVFPCAVSGLVADTTVDDTLRVNDCPSPGDPRLAARLYRVAGQPGDSVSILLVGSAFPAALALYDSTAFSGSPRAQAQACPAVGGGVCLVYQVWSRSGVIGLTVATRQEGRAGAYRLAVRAPRAPAAAANLRQFGADGATEIAAGGTTRDTVVTLAAAAADPDPWDSVRLEVEVRPAGEAFAGLATAAGDFAPGGLREVPVGGLPGDRSYRWQARAVDRTGRAGPWVPYGLAGAAGGDFRIVAGASQLAFTQAPTGATAGATITPAAAVAARKASGSVDTAYAGVISVAISAGSGAPGATLGGRRSVQAVRGVATFGDLSIDRAAAGYRLDASTSGLTGAQSDPFAILPGPAKRLVFTVQPSDTRTNQTITPPVEVTVVDAYGNTVTGFNGTVTVAIGNNPSLLGLGTLSGTRNVPVVNGVAVFGDLSIDAAGQGYTLLAACSGLADAESAPFNVTGL